MFQVVSINTRQDVMVRMSVLAGVVRSIAEKLVELATVSILLNFTLSTKYCWKKMSMHQLVSNSERKPVGLPVGSRFFDRPVKPVKFSFVATKLHLNTIRNVGLHTHIYFQNKTVLWKMALANHTSENKGLLSVFNRDICISAIDVWLSFSFLAWLCSSYRSIVAFMLQLLSICAGQSSCDARAQAGCGVW